MHALTRTRLDQDWGKSFGVTTGQIALLLPLLVVVALIQVLPQVDLPDMAFHENTAPIITKSRAIASPVLSIATHRDLVTIADTATLAASSEGVSTTPHRSSLSLPILHSAILC